MKPIKPINRDVEPFDSENGGTYTSQNTAFEKLGSRSNERGFDIVLGEFLAEGQKVVGFIEHTDGIVVVFSTYLDNVSEIGFIKKSGSSTIYSVICKDSLGNLLLNFNTSYAITGELARTVNNQYLCAFRDDINPPRVFNLDNLPFEVDVDGTILDNGDLINMFPNYTYPRIQSLEVFNTGGSMSHGAYFLLFTYEFEDGDETNYIGQSLPIYTVKENLETPIEGYGDETSTEVKYYTTRGKDDGSSGSSSAKVVVENVDTKFRKLNIYFIVEKAGVTSSFYWGSQDIVQDTVEFIFDGKETEAVVLTDLITENTTFSKVHTITQVNRRLYFANLESGVDLPEFQHAANSAKLKWETETLSINDYSLSHKDPTKIYLSKSFIPDEVYAFYIEFILKNGESTRLYHIPNTEPVTNDELSTVDREEEIAIDPNAKKYQVRNYAQADGTLSYWENRNETYPDVKGFNDDPILGDISGNAVKHHKMPSIKKLMSFGEEILSPSTEYIDGYCKLDNIVESEVGSQNEVFTAMPSSWITTGNVFTPQTYSGTAPQHTPGGNLGTILINYDCVIRLEYYNKTVSKCNEDSPPSIDSMELRVRLYLNDVAILEDTKTGTNTLGNTYQAKSTNRLSKVLKVKAGDKIHYYYETSITVSGVGDSENIDYASTICLDLHTISSLDTYDNTTPTATKTTESLVASLDSITIPIEIQSQIQGYRIHAAKRSFEESTILDSCTPIPTSLLSQRRSTGSNTSVCSRTYSGYLEGSNWVGVSPNEFVMGENKVGDTSTNPPVYGNENYSHKYLPYNLVKTKPTVIPQYFDVEANFKVDKGIYLPYTNSTHVEKIEKFEYVDNSTNQVNDNTQIYGETAHVELEGRSYVSEIFENDAEQERGSVPLLNLKQIKSDIYSIFENQETFLCSELILLGETSPKLKGDSFVQFEFLPIAEARFDNFERGLVTPPYDNVSTVGYNYIPMPIYSSLNLNLREEILTFPEIGDGSDEFRPALSLGYNDSYSKVNDYVVRDINGENNAELDNKYPHRIHRSISIGTEENELKWRNFLPLDYYEMPTNRGVIWNLDTYDDRLIIHMTDGIFLTRGEETLQTTDTQVSIGTADIFERDPRELLPNREGHAGTFSQIGAIMTKYGYLFIDEKRGKVYLLRAGQNGFGLDTLNTGLDDFFRDNLAIEENLNIDLTSFENVDVQDNPHNGKGFSVVFDDYYDRFIICKVDGETSWTLTYSLKSKGWVSYHSYTCNVLFNLVYRTHSINIDYNNLYGHNSKTLKGTYHDQMISTDSYVDIIFNGDTPINKIFSSIYWNSDIIENNNAANNRKTISRIFIYNNYQASAEIDVVNLKNARKAGGRWACNDFRDILTDDAREALAPILKDGSIDPNVIDINKAWYKKNRFRNNYIIVRFIFDNINDELLYLHDVSAEIRRNIR
jgi:hypothetical protein